MGNIINQGTWLGNTDSYITAVKAMQQLHDMPVEKKMEMRTAWEQSIQAQDQTPHHPLLEVPDGSEDVGIITVSGQLVDGITDWWGRIMGLVGYGDIRNALITATELNLSNVIIDWTTPGGTSLGVKELSDFMIMLRSTHDITLTSHCSTACQSAGMWLATAADKFYASGMAELGSIGVLSVATEFTKMLEDEGITKSIFKSAPLKAVGLNYEKLSKEGAAEIQSNVDEANDFFIRAISEHRGLSEDFVRTTVADGTVWFAQEAQDKQMIDGIKTFDELFDFLTKSSSGNIEEDDPFSKQIEVNTMATRRKKVLDTKAAALVANGVSVEQATEHLESVPDTTTNADATPTPTPSADATPTPTPSADATPIPKEEEEGQTSLLSQISALTEQLVSAKVEAATASAKLAEAESVQSGLKEVVAKATQRVFVGLGANAPDLDTLKAMDSQALLAQFMQVDAQLQERLGAGGQVTVVTDDQEDEALTEASKIINKCLLDQAKI